MSNKLTLALNLLKICKNEFMEAIFPSNIYCICCDNIINRTRPYSLCDECLLNLRWANEKTCEKCGKIISKDNDKKLCKDCMVNTHYFEKAFTCVEYGMYEKILLKEYKFKDKPYFGEKLSNIMCDKIAGENLHIDIIIPMPIHKNKEKKRGYNQAELMALGISKQMRIPMEKDIIYRNRITKPMNKLNPQERKENIRGSFTLKPKKCNMIKGKSILLIDDIYTTGSTVDECSKTLLKEGASYIYVLCFAAGANINTN